MSSSTQEQFEFPSSAPSSQASPGPASLRLIVTLDVAAIRARQEQYLQRDLERIDNYFDNYERELTARASRSTSENARLKTTDRLAAAKTEHARRRADQVARHEIRIQPHLDACLLVAEPAWRAVLAIEREHVPQTVEARFVPRAQMV